MPDETPDLFNSDYADMAKALLDTLPCMDRTVVWKTSFREAEDADFVQSPIPALSPEEALLV